MLDLCEHCLNERLNLGPQPLEKGIRVTSLLEKGALCCMYGSTATVPRCSQKLCSLYNPCTLTGRLRPRSADCRERVFGESVLPGLAVCPLVAGPLLLASAWWPHVGLSWRRWRRRRLCSQNSERHKGHPEEGAMLVRSVVRLCCPHLWARTLCKVGKHSSTPHTCGPSWPRRSFFPGGSPSETGSCWPDPAFNLPGKAGTVFKKSVQRRW